MGGLILLADDSPHARRMGSEYLDGLGYAVITAADGPAALEAMEALGKQMPELILVDAALPGMPEPAQGGMQLARRVKADPRWRQIPVVVLTGALAPPSDAMAEGADGVLRKPLSSAGLQAWLTGRGAARPREERLSAAEALERAVREAALGTR